MDYYNENDPYAAAWLRALVAAGHLPAGDVDDRSITDVRAAELAGYTACHFFAGIGGWAVALALASWPAGREVWTGSCPCQPFSAAGRHAGASDGRHLWPVWRELIAQRRPRVVLGEQVEAAVAHDWLDAVRSDLEHLGYAFAPVSLCAACVGAPHIRQRLYFVADDDDARLPHPEPETLVAARRRQEGRAVGEPRGAWWSACEWIACRDGKHRPIEPGVQPVAHGVAARVGRLRAYGNALVPQVAAEVIAAYLDVRTMTPPGALR